MSENEIDYLEYCSECGEYFEKTEMKEIDGEFFCRDCSNRCAECNQMIDEDNTYNKSFCSRECYSVYFHDLYEDDWKEDKYNDSRDEY
jgi:hypothetical protein